MAEPSPTKKISAAWVTLLFGLGYLLEYGFSRLQGTLSALAYNLYWENGVNLFYALNAQALVSRVHSAFSLVLLLASPVALVVVMGRPLWERRKLRRPGPSKIASYLRAHPVRMGQVLPWAAAFLWLIAEDAMQLAHALYLSARPGPYHFVSHALREIGQDFSSLGFLAGSVLGMVGVAATVRFGLRRLSTDEEQRTADPAPSSFCEDKASFSAVAVTASTRGAVAALAAVSIAAMVCAATFRSNGTLAVMVLAYVLAAMGTATLFRRVSRIAVGIDGILILGADKTRFFGYADLDSVEARGSDVLLKRHGRTALRLQLHDADVGRAPELAARIDRARLRAAVMRSQGADRLMQATQSSRGASQRLASSARGGLDYRQPAMAREQLWELVEGPVSNADARRVAAEALAHDLSVVDRERLRVAAGRCAEPQARVALARVLQEESDDEETASPILRKRALG